MELFAPMKLPCGGTAYWDESSGISYRCELCGAVVGSMGQPRRCKDEAQKWENWEKLGGKGWDYFAEVDDNEQTRTLQYHLATSLRRLD